MKVAGKVFALTGAGNGIGRQIALELLARGARVALIDRDQAALDQTLELSGPGGARVSTHVADVSDPDVVDDLPAQVIAQHGQVDGLLNVAGIIHRFVSSAELERHEIRRVVDVNFWGTVHTTLAFLPELRKRPEAAIINISSLSALVAFAGQTFYSATKAAVKQFTEGLYEELIDSNIAVTVVFPGNVSTDISGNSGVTMIDAGGRKVRATTPEKTAREIVDAIEKGKPRLLVGADAKLLGTLTRLAPVATMRLIATQMKSVL